MLTTAYLPGAPSWLDVTTPDLEASTAFYTGLFGWDSVSLGPAHSDYRFCQLGGRTVAGISPHLPPGGQAAWLTYFHTPEADAVAKQVEQAGGRLLAAPRDIEGQGRMAVFADPAGASFAVWQPGGTPGLGLVTEQGSLCWVELFKPDPGGVRDFYRAVFGWRIEDLPMGGETYPVITPAEGDESASVAGIVRLPEGERAHWLPYFEVPDCDATAALAQRLGGTLRGPATSTEGVGRMAFAADPFGAAFAVITSSA
ncbi:VOC family protein [Nonomuraea salmonea]|uniref:VOC family protein n=2 Tax=Nonomuraea salmonea TaxID=46181 RepID=A0ABV5NNM2_9ACTN